MVSKGNYERIEVTFNKSDDLDIELYKYIESKTKFISKPSFVKQLLYEKMMQEKESNE